MNQEDYYAYIEARLGSYDTNYHFTEDLKEVVFRKLRLKNSQKTFSELVDKANHIVAYAVDEIHDFDYHQIVQLVKKVESETYALEEEVS